MARQYSVLNRKTTLLAVFFTVLLGFTPPLLAQDDPYTVSGVRVDATSTSAVDARRQAFEQAQQAAFSLLASRFLAPEQMKTFQAPPATQITPLVDDFEITNEKLSPTRYVGTYTFRFRHGASQNLINARGEAANAAAAAASVPPSQYVPPVGMPAPSAGAANSYDGVYNPYNRGVSPSYPAATAEPAQAAGNALKLRVHFSSIGEWTLTQRTLRSVAGVLDLRTLSLSPAEATVELRYQGTEAALRQALGMRGMTLNQSGGTAAPQAYNPYAAAYNATTPVGGDSVYDLNVSAVPASPVLPIPATPPVSAYR